MSLPAASIVNDRDDTRRDDAAVLFGGVTWADYERLLAIRAERPVPRIAYLDGVIEVMAPSVDHERIKSYLGALVETWCLVMGVDVVPLGSWTLKAEPQHAGVEPDECYILGGAEKPRPDIAIEVVWTSGGLGKLAIYRRLGVPEVWTWRSGQLRVNVLRDGEYVEIGRSEQLPGIDLQLILSLLDRPTVTQAQRELMATLKSP